MGTLSVDKLVKTSQGAAEFTLPATDGAAGTVWQTDGSGQLSVATVGSSGIATDAVTATQIAANAVTASEIAATTITPAQMANSAFLANRNRIINGNFDVWQRGTSFAGVTATGYQADRWEVQPAAGCTMTIDRQAFTAGQTDVPYEPSYFLRADITTAGSANAEISQKIEDVRTFAGQTIIASFYAKSTAGTQTLNCRFHQDFGSGGSTRVTTGISAKVLSSSWQKFTFTLALGSLTGKTIGTSSYLAFNFYWDNSSTSNDVDLAQVQVEAGSVATPFEYKSISQELEACQRYCEKLHGEVTNSLVSMQLCYDTTGTQGVLYYSKKRAGPTITQYSAGVTGWFLHYENTSAVVSAVPTFDMIDSKTSRITASVASGLTQGEAAYLRTGNAADSYIIVDAEI